ncbi:hypothetical protein [Croceibacterium salegens]|nr:hypothetical protein [Croceibacterium salegens]
MGRKRIVTALVVLVMTVIAFAWIDGGREELRMIERAIELPGDGQ